MSLTGSGVRGAVALAVVASWWAATARPARGAEAAAAPVERRLHLAGAEASSFLVSDWNRFQENYLPLYVGDDDPKTAWTEGAKGDGVGEWLRVKVTALADVTGVRLRIRNGYQKNARIFAANGRARGVKVVLLPSGKAVDAELADRQDWQEITLAQPAGPLAAVEIRIQSVYPGKSYDDLCISDLQLLVTASAPDNPAFEKGRFDQILKWKAERVAAAKLFKTAMGKRFPFSPQYRVSNGSTDDEEDLNHVPAPDGTGPAKPVPCPPPAPGCPIREQLALASNDAAAMKTHAAALARARALMDKLAHLPPVKVVPGDHRRIPTIDGLCTPTIQGCDGEPCYQSLAMPGNGLVAFMNAAQLATLEAKDAPSIEDIDARKPGECDMRDVVKTWAWALRGAAAADGTPGPLQGLFLATCGAVLTREGYGSESVTQLLVYGADGNLDLVVGPTYAAMLRWRPGTQGPVLAGGRMLRDTSTLEVEEVVKITQGPTAAGAAAPPLR